MYINSKILKENLHIRIELSSLIMAPRKLESLRYSLLLSHQRWMCLLSYCDAGSLEEPTKSSLSRNQ